MLFCKKGLCYLSQRFTELLGGKKTVVLLGEAGSGKSEIAINFALGLRGETNRKIHFFDMDQTKPLFRSRDVANKIRSAGIEFHSNITESIEDVAAIVPGVKEAINEPESFVILDIGGNEHGARMIGQFSQNLNSEDCVVLFVINPYRPWSRDLPSITETIRRITVAARTENIRVVSNPNFGPETTAEDIIKGNEKLKAMLGGKSEVSFVCALERLCPELEGKITEPLIPVKIYILYPWQD
jgi:hypothetical protein